MKLYDLGRVQNAVKAATGLEVTHAYDDLAFVEHSAFMIQFDPEDLKRFACHFSAECPSADRAKLLAQLQAASLKEGMTCAEGKIFTLEQVEGKEEVRVLFR